MELFDKKFFEKFLNNFIEEKRSITVIIVDLQKEY